MAARYWVGGTGTWDASTTTNWSTSSGGAGGASAPGSSDDVFLDSNSGTGTITRSGTVTIQSLDCTGYAGTLTISATTTITGNVTLASGMTLNGTGSLRLNPNTNSIFDAAGCSITMTSTSTALVLDADSANIDIARNFTITGAIACQGTSPNIISTNNYNISCGYFIVQSGSAQISLGSSTITISGSGGTRLNLAQSTRLTSHTSLIILNPTGSTVTANCTDQTNPLNLQVNGSSAVTLSNNSYWNDLDLSNYTNNPGSTNISIYGDFSLNSTVSYEMGFTFRGGGAKNFNGADVLECNFTLNAPGESWVLSADFLCNILGITAGTFDANDFDVNCNGFISSGSTTRTINMGNGTWTMLSGWNMTTMTNLTFNAENSQIIFTSTSALNITCGSDIVFNNVWFNRGSATTAINLLGAGKKTFNQLKDTGTAAHSLVITSGTTIEVNDFKVTGSSGNEITINSNDTSTHNLVKLGGGVINCDYLNIQHSVATPANTWYAGTNSTDNQSVATAGSGWIFQEAPESNMLLMF